ncbi:Lrp/AsnC family transcriptional regulator [Sphingomonas sp. QA11]|uniref:Lrp/AsnC family transcriptional regulator n=1 Tax=Sphingomonas sp. QA11 TaxID=2950605 RepID=UPI00234AF054|nr:Lrp/AsnC family transcriptional regulator [Sphingomonas sp. QA11]WCM26011.1 Lrp/AsnC family transcriptional regulator [Sphingomonas sp. QA11]
MRSLDGYDLALLNALQENNLQTADNLALTVALSPSAIARRVRRLRDEGIIMADVAVISGSVGSFLSALVDVQLDHHALPAIEALLRELGASPYVQAIFEIAGPFDLALLVTVTNMDAYNAFADTMLASAPVVRRYETRFIKKRRKLSIALPIGSIAR